LLLVWSSTEVFSILAGRSMEMAEMAFMQPNRAQNGLPGNEKFKQVTFYAL
jgi:hypothetical protein